MTTSDELVSNTNPAAARVQKLAVPVASPGMCGICGKNEHPDGFADARLDFEFYGTFYLCGDCVGDYARLFGWLHPMQARALAKKYDELSKELDLHREALLNLEESVEHLTNYRMLRSTITNANDDGNLDAVTSESDEETDESPSASVVQLPGTTSAPEPDLSESVAEQGPNDVPEPRGDESSDITIVEL